jgi:hypothetical protein
MASDRVASDRLSNPPSLQSGGWDVASLGGHGLEVPSAGEDIAGDVGALAQAVRDQLARDIADIEQASAALRRAEPGLETWTAGSPAAAAPPPRPLWLLIGLLWLSTALVTVGAVAAVAIFAG